METDVIRDMLTCSLRAWTMAESQRLGELANTLATGRIVDRSYACHYAAMLRQSPEHYSGVLSVDDLRAIYLHGCLSLDEFERFLVPVIHHG